MANVMGNIRSVGVFSFMRKNEYGEENENAKVEESLGCKSADECRKMYSDRNTFNVLY